MTPRERFRRLMSGQAVDRLPVLALEPYEFTALDRWETEGLPAGVRPEDFLGMSRLRHVPVNFGPVPHFPGEVLADDGEYETVTMYLGAAVRRRKDNPTMFYGHVDHPLKTRADWEAYKFRLDPYTPGRLPGDWPAQAAELAASPDPVGLCFFPFFFRFGFYTMGMERFLTAFHDDPDLMHDMFRHLGELALAVIQPVLQSVPLDYAVFGEDLAGKNGPLISPQTYREFWGPYQEPILAALREAGVPVICQWTAGDVRPLLPELLRQGFNCTWPLEVTAGLDAPALRRDYGNDLLLGGNIAKEAVMAGPEAIDAELARLEPLIREGRFLPALDDMGAPDMAWAHYRYLIERLQEFTW